MAYLTGGRNKDTCEFENMDHPLNRTSKYDKEKHHAEWLIQCEEREKFCKEMDEKWGKDWSKI